MDPAGPVELTVDVGSQRKLASVEIAWEFPAKAFTVSISTDGVKWSEVHATDSNILSSSRIQLGSAHASKIKVVMHQVRMVTHALHDAAACSALSGSWPLSWARCVRHSETVCSGTSAEKRAGRLRRGSKE